MDPFFAADDGSATDDLQRTASHPSTTLKTTPLTPWRPMAAREAMIEAYNGSDLKNLCVTAAYRPVRELLKIERLKEMEIRKTEVEQKTAAAAEDSDKSESKKVAVSFAAEGAVMNKLKQWNELYGEGGSRKKQQLTYFL
ncbi:hypothetical protein ZWY2020_022061 [Hordeum vulgare]|nr:hypothetical protein ZWY2020_022061 [Hordeum vulgare]